ncbi:helix-turn-helix domain-containing protein [Corynebacterium fournieri]|uniref:helix-turn-helix domain-containing protein n=1 Tax=Corynebacterium fournieri TaxID=1852390 RepID=UPI001E5D555E|nr:helix-turn-helix domain-containing protein [Corynebacterium fournieri]
MAEALVAQRRELFGVLEAEDAARNTDYARTLSVFLQHGGQLAHTADALGVHRHTVRSRMARIQKLCGIDLSDPATFAEAFFAATAEV